MADTAMSPYPTIRLQTPRSKGLSDEALIDLVQRQTFRFFWEGAHPVSGLARDRSGLFDDPQDDVVSVAGSGFAVMAVIAACERGWVTRAEALERVTAMLNCLERATCYHGLYPHLMNGATGATIPFSRKDDGGDVVESSMLFQGLLCARQYFDGADPLESSVRERIAWLWHEAEWDWYTRDGRNALTWHWSPTNGWALDHEIHGWNECLITYVLAVSAPRYPISHRAYHEGWTNGRAFLNRRSFEGIELPLGPDWGGPLFFAYHSFCGLDPRGLSDAYADYWVQNVSHAKINHAYCVRNPRKHKGYGHDVWGLSASESVRGYEAHAPDNDLGVITPSAALSCFPYMPKEAMRALRYYYEILGDRIWGRFGFVDAFSLTHDWYSDSYLAIDQGPTVVMIENFRSGLLWRLFMSNPEIQQGLRKLNFKSRWLEAGHAGIT